MKKLLSFSKMAILRHRLLGLVCKKKHVNSPVSVAPYYCPVCKSEVHRFERLSDYYIELMDKNQYIHSIFCAETLNFLRYSCPRCSSSDRNRLYALFLERRFKEFEHANISINFLDIAPDVVLSKWIKSWKCINYRSVDLFMDEVDDKADITDLHIYEDEKFDVLLCSHVLEHIEHDEKAIAELFRVLKRGGFAIIMVPILLNLENDYENFNLKTPEERWKHFGQDDHVRLYSKNGFVSKLKKAGFKVEQLGENYFGTSVFDKNGIHPRSVLYIVEK